MDTWNDFIKPFVTAGKWLLFIAFVVIIWIQNYQIRNYRRSEKECLDLY